MEFGQNHPDRLFQGLQIPFDNLPNDLRIHGEIIVTKNVSHPGDRLPSDLWMFPLVSLIHSLSRLAKYLKVPEDGVLERARSEDGLPSVAGIFLHPSNTLEDVLNVSSLRFHSGTASRSTASRISGLRDRRMTT